MADNPELQDAMSNVYDAFRPSIDKQRRGARSWKTTDEAADALGWDVLDAIGIKEGTALNAEQIEAVRRTHLASLRDLAGWAERWKADPSQWENYVRAFARQIAVTKSLQGVATEAGRALNIFKKNPVLESLADQFMRKIAKADPATVKAKMNVIAEVLADEAMDAAAVSKILRQLYPATTREKIREVWINGLLSLPKTHIVNLTGNLSMIALKAPERIAASGIDALHHLLTGKPRQIFFREAVDSTMGNLAGLSEGVRNAIKVFRTEIPIDKIDKLELGTRMAVGGKIGRAVRIPGRALQAEDEFFKAVTQTSEVYALAARDALKRGLRGEDYAKRVAEIIANPPDDILKAAAEEARYRTFQTELGSWGKRMQSVLQHEEMRFVVPFFRTTANIAKTAIQYSPLGFLNLGQKAARGVLKEGEALTRGARATVGSMIAGSLMYYVSQTGGAAISGGGPKDPEKRKELMAAGWMPYSIKIGDTWYQYGRIDPIASIVGMTVDMYEHFDAMDEGDRRSTAGAIVSALSRNLVSKTYLQGVSRALDAISMGDRWADKWVQQLAGSFVPSAVAGAARALDPMVREPATVAEAVQSRIPVLSRSLPAKLDSFGRPVTRDEGAVSQIVSPVGYSREKVPVEHVLARHKMQYSMEAAKQSIIQAAHKGDRDAAYRAAGKHNQNVMAKMNAMRTPISDRFVQDMLISEDELVGMANRAWTERQVREGKAPPQIKDRWAELPFVSR